MNQKSRRVLEYDKIIEMLMGQAASDMAKKIVSELAPHVSEHLVREAQAETTEAASAIACKGMPPLGAFYDIDNAVHLATKGGTLTMRDLLQVLYNMNTARSMAGFLKSDLPELPMLFGIREVISVPRKLIDSIDRCIVSEDEMSDNASVELRDIRRSIGRQNEALRAKLNQIINSASNRAMLQDAIVTMRQGRYVIPVKQEHKARFPGIVHDQSGSGATLFIEPQAVVNLNNELRELELAEKVEMERILAELSGEVAECHHDLLNNQKLLVKLDFMFAKGKLSAKQKAVEPEINTESRIRMKNARHPLIAPDKVVPVSISVGGAYDTLIITGPNTGGKTVTLKTAGLLSMMAQAGLHVPAEPGTETAVFQNIFADIGDEQSIEQSLSTFSSHMNNIVGIVDNTDFNTLVLLDELGAGTDPTEGAALAISILEDLAQKGAKTIATTHYTELKKYAISKHGVENASMEFDVDTLSPTYRLFIGIPGKSNAFEISQKLGLPPEIIGNARTLLGRGDIQFEEIVSAIEADRKHAEAERDEAVMLALEARRQKEELDKKRAKFEEQREKLLENARDEARGIIEEASTVAAEVQKELKELARAESHSERTRLLDENRKKLKEAGSKYRRKLKPAANANPASADELSIGCRVKVVTFDQEGEVLTMPDDKGDLMVQLGLLKANVNIADISVTAAAGGGQTGEKSVKYGQMYRQKVQSIALSLNVQGENLDDAKMDVDKYLDDAFMAGLEKVTIIHGRGEGVLRGGLHSMFKTHKHVKKFRKGTYNEGGDGVTVVELR
ncbi:MAG: endonuclease MutS2 [Clostridiales bacterium]|nr:endonuclease MutS2 [Clostridiales bacterium]